MRENDAVNLVKFSLNYSTMSLHCRCRCLKVFTVFCFRLACVFSQLKRETWSWYLYHSATNCWKKNDINKDNLHYTCTLICWELHAIFCITSISLYFCVKLTAPSLNLWTKTHITSHNSCETTFTLSIIVADPGFLKGRQPKGGALTYYVCHFLMKTAWNWKQLDKGREGHASLAPLCMRKCIMQKLIQSRIRSPHLTHTQT